MSSAAFPLVGDVSSTIIPIILIPGNPVDVSGRIFAFNANGDSALVGTWDITTSETPLPAALPLFASGLGALGLLGWRRRSRKIIAKDRR